MQSIEIHTSYKFPTLNKWYSASHWSSRHKQKKEATTQLKCDLEGIKFPPFKQLIVSYHYSFKRRDVDNTITAVKFLLDTLKNLGYIEDDSPDIIKEVRLVYEESTSPKQYFKIFFIN